jgi:hypothetical protein
LISNPHFYPKLFICTLKLFEKKERGRAREFQVLNFLLLLYGPPEAASRRSHFLHSTDKRERERENSHFTFYNIPSAVKMLRENIVKNMKHKLESCINRKRKREIEKKALAITNDFNSSQVINPRKIYYRHSLSKRLRKNFLISYLAHGRKKNRMCTKTTEGKNTFIDN